MNVNSLLINIVCEMLSGKNINTILEIGSRDGDDSDFLKKHFGIDDEYVHIVEPNFLSHNKIVKEYPNYNVYDYAIHNYNGTCEFNNIIGNSDLGISSVKNRPDGYYNTVNTKKIEVNCITGKKLLGIIGSDVDYCQIDVEGLSFEVVEGFGEDIVKLRYIMIECEHRVVWENQKIYDDVRCLLEKTHRMIYTDNLFQDKLQSNTLWELMT